MKPYRTDMLPANEAFTKSGESDDKIIERWCAKRALEGWALIAVTYVPSLTQQIPGRANRFSRGAIALTFQNTDEGLNVAEPTNPPTSDTPSLVAHVPSPPEVLTTNEVPANVRDISAPTNGVVQPS